MILNSSSGIISRTRDILIISRIRDVAAEELIPEEGIPWGIITDRRRGHSKNAKSLKNCFLCQSINSELRVFIYQWEIEISHPALIRSPSGIAPSALWPVVPHRNICNRIPTTQFLLDLFEDGQACFLGQGAENVITNDGSVGLFVPTGPWTKVWVIVIPGLRVDFTALTTPEVQDIFLNVHETCIDEPTSWYGQGSPSNGGEMRFILHRT